MNTRYFECNLPNACPDYIHESKREWVTSTLQRIHARMEKLEDALEMSGMDAALFAKLAKVLFDNFYQRFESCIAEELTVWVQTCDDGMTTAEHRLEWPNAEVVVDCAFLTVQEWETIRHLGLGGSDVPAVLGVSQYRNAQETYHDKVWSPELIASDDSQPIFDRGHFLEDRVVEAFMRLTGFKRLPETRMFRSKSYPHATADIDAILQAPDGRLFVFEAKTTVAENYTAWSNQQVPASYLPQVRHYPAVLNDDRISGTYIGCIFTVDLIAGGLYVGSSYTGEQFVARFIPRNTDAEAVQLFEAEMWWKTYVQEGKEPPPSNIPADDIGVIRRFHTGYADPKQPVLDLTGEASSLLPVVEDYLRLTEEKAGKQKILNALDMQIKDMQTVFMERMGTAVEARINLGEEYFEIKWAPYPKDIVDMERLKIAHPEVYDDVVSHNPESYRKFTLKKKKVKGKGTTRKKA